MKPFCSYFTLAEVIVGVNVSEAGLTQIPLLQWTLAFKGVFDH